MNIEYELRSLEVKKKEIVDRSERVLRKLFGEKQTLRWLSNKDRTRLTILLVWEERYGIPVEEILEYLLPFLQKIKKGKKTKKFAGFPVKVWVLVSKTTEGILKQWIEKEFPDQTRLRTLKRLQRLQIIQERNQGNPDLPTRVDKNLLDFRTIEEWNQYYRSKMDRIREWNLMWEVKMKRDGRPYRNSPWR